MTIVSHAQNFEDVILNRTLEDVESGFYIDIGANDPDIDSVTRFFYEKGWTGINIEPVSEWIERLNARRPRDTNLHLAIGESEGTSFFYEVVGTGLSTMNRDFAERHARERGYEIREYDVPVASLQSVCEEHDCKDIHFLKVDVEGAEALVLKGADFVRFRPWIVVIESTLPNEPIEDFEHWEPLLLEAGYEFAYFDGLNRFYVADEHSDLKQRLALPPNVFDNFVLGGDASSSFQNEISNLKKARDQAVSDGESWRREFNQLLQRYKDLETSREDDMSAAEQIANSLKQHLDSLNKDNSDAIARATQLAELLAVAREEKGAAEANAKHLAEQLEAVRQEKVAAETWAKESAERLATLKEEKGAAEAYAHHLAEQLEAMRQKKATVMAKENELSEQMRVLLSEKTTIERRLHDEVAEKSSLVSELQATHDYNKSLIGKVNSLTNQLLTDKATIKSLQKEFNDLKATSAAATRELEAQIRALHASKSWQITRPLRKFLELLIKVTNSIKGKETAETAPVVDGSVGDDDPSFHASKNAAVSRSSANALPDNDRLSLTDPEIDKYMDRIYREIERRDRN